MILVLVEVVEVVEVVFVLDMNDRMKSSASFLLKDCVVLVATMRMMVTVVRIWDSISQCNTSALG